MSGFSPAFRVASDTLRFMPSPLSGLRDGPKMPFLSASALRAIFAQSFLRMVAIHMVISLRGTSRLRGGRVRLVCRCFPSQSVPPDASTTWIRASARRISSRNWFPKPRPSQAPGTMPAMSINSTGSKSYTI